MLPAAHAVLDMEAIQHNLKRIRDLATNSKVMAVIKANAYGHGAIRFAKALPDVEAFAVARVDEGIRLRDAGIVQRIAVLQGFVCDEELQKHADYELEPVIHSTFQVDLLEKFQIEKPIAIWLKLDSGMHRLGLSLDEFKLCYQRLYRNSSIQKPIATMTHLAKADDLNDQATQHQIECFKSQANFNLEQSIANSAGLFAWKEAHAAWIRPGIALYGASPFPNRIASDEGLKPVMSLRTRLIAIKHLNAGDAIGYGGDWICPCPTRLGIAAIGYGDGYPRQVPSGTPVLVQGKRVSLVGRVSMDMITLDLNSCPEAKLGDSVTLWGDGLPVEEIARYAATIPYVLLCNVTQRVKFIEK